MEKWNSCWVIEKEKTGITRNTSLSLIQFWSPVNRYTSFHLFELPIFPTLFFLQSMNLWGRGIVHQLYTSFCKPLEMIIIEHCKKDEFWIYCITQWHQISVEFSIYIYFIGNHLSMSLFLLHFRWNAIERSCDCVCFVLSRVWALLIVSIAVNYRINFMRFDMGIITTTYTCTAGKFHINTWRIQITRISHVYISHCIITLNSIRLNLWFRLQKNVALHNEKFELFERLTDDS